DWPGNVRELRNAAERYALGLGGFAPRARPEESKLSLTEQVDAFERAVIERSLAESGGKISSVMEQLDIPRRTLSEKMARVGLDFQVPVMPALKGFLPGQRESVPGSTVVRGADISARWWEVFRSRALTRLIQDGIENNQDLRAAEAAVRAAQANANALRGTL